MQTMHSRRCFTWVLLICALSAGMPAQSAYDTARPPQFRLPPTVFPERYKVDLTVVPDKDTFRGTIDIDLDFKQSSSVLWLNAEKWAIKDAALTTGGQTAAVQVITEPKDLVGFSFARSIGLGPAKLRVNYEGRISRKDMAGIFQVKEGDHWYIYSQFENISARRAFPCFDEPGYKVRCRVTLLSPMGDPAFSNLLLPSRNPRAPGPKTVGLPKTSPMQS